jgi:hypothetical protein
MGQRGGRARLLFESSNPIGVGRQGRRDDFDRDVTFEPGIVGAVHFAHSTSAQLGEDLVATERLSNHSQILAWATVDPPKLALVSRASEGGPPAPTSSTTS